MTTESTPATTPELNFCPRDPKIETNLSCGKCGEFICPKCLVQTPVGARCEDCARMKKNPAYDPSSGETSRAVAAGIGTAAGIGLVLGALGVLAYKAGGQNPYTIVAVVGLAGMGWTAGEVVYRVSKFKKSRGLQYAAGLCTFAGYIAAITSSTVFGLRGGFTDLWPLLGFGLAVYVAMGRVRA